jgi:hypothetical protein
MCYIMVIDLHMFSHLCIPEMKLRNIVLMDWNLFGNFPLNKFVSFYEASLILFGFRLKGKTYSIGSNCQVQLVSMSSWIYGIFWYLITQLLHASTCWILMCKQATSLLPPFYPSNTIILVCRLSGHRFLFLYNLQLRKVFLDGCLKIYINNFRVFSLSHLFSPQVFYLCPFSSFLPPPLLFSPLLPLPSFSFLHLKYFFEFSKF